MTFFAQIGAGINGYMAALRFTLRHRMGWMYAVPALLWVLITFGLFTLLLGPADRLSTWLAGFLELGVAETDADLWDTIKAWFNGARQLVTLVVLKLAIAYLLYKVNKYLVLVLLSPLLAYASERTEEICTGAQYPFSWPRLLHDALRGSLIALRNGLLEVLASIVVWSMSLLLPIMLPVTAILLFLISAYFYGFSMFDYIMERRRLRIGESVRAVNDRLGAVLANGTLFSLLMKVPLLGMTMAPVLGAVGAMLAEERMRARPALP